MSKLIFCDLCGEEHLEIKKRIEKTEFKGYSFEYEVEFGYCPELNEEILIDEMLDKNLFRMRDAYRKAAGLLTSGEIKELRNELGLSQKDLAAILSMGGATIARIETKVIQERATDEAIRRLKDDPAYLIEKLDLVKEIIGEKVYNKVLKNLDSEDTSIYTRKTLQIKYLKYKEKSLLNGQENLKLEKIDHLIRYFVENCDHVFKTKLNKLLWYADFYFFKNHGKGISGLVYNHLPYGAVPKGIEEILTLSTGTVVEEIFNENLGSYFYPIKLVKNFDMNLFTSEELEILEKVVKKFKNFKNKEISDYMHEEEAYKHTKESQVISYNFAAQLREL